MTILDGKALSNKIKEEVKVEVEELQKEKHVTPGLAVILVGNDAASATYVGMKAKSCKNAGIYSVVHEMPDTISQDEILDIIDRMNENPNLDGILVQLPLPSQVDTTTILEAIDPQKDVDGFHPYNVGRMVSNLDAFAPATPAGCMKILEEYNISTKGKDAVVVGASNIVGRPMSAMLLRADCTVTTCHIHTQNLKDITSRADILVTAIGCPKFFTADHVKEGAVVVDIGINRVDGKVVGDVDFEEVSKKASYITPVPGGVGPMTIAMLLYNTVKAFEATLD